MTATPNDDPVRRALAAYYRSAGSDGYDKPANTSGEAEHDGHRYVVLRNTGGVLAVYRIRNDGKLKRLRRWPTEINAEVTS